MRSMRSVEEFLSKFSDSLNDLRSAYQGEEITTDFMEITGSGKYIWLKRPRLEPHEPKSILKVKPQFALVNRRSFLPEHKNDVAREYALYKTKYF